MTTSDETALVLTALASAAGIAVVFWMWRRHRRHQRSLRSRHPSARPPIRVDLVDEGDARRIRLGVPPGAPAVVIDIVSFRPSDPTGAWEGEPLDEPLVLGPGAETVLGSRLPADATMVDVVVAWTAHHDAGAVQESRLFRLPPERDAPPAPARAAAGLPGRAALGLGAILVGGGLLVVASLGGGDRDGEAAPAPPTAPIVETSTTAPDTPPTSASPTSTRPSSTDVPTSAATTSTGPPATAPPPTSPGTTDDTTSSTDATTTTPPLGDGPQVLAEGRVEPCRFGDECLVVGFTIVGFDGSPSEYVCEFDDGSRFTFTFVGDGAETACATGSATATITVEVEGVRSETISRP